MRRLTIRGFTLAMCLAVFCNSLHASTSSAAMAGTEERSVAESVVPTRDSTTSASSKVADSRIFARSSEDYADGQASPVSGQQPLRRHSHRMRNILIGVGAILAFAVIAAVASK